MAASNGTLVIMGRSGRKYEYDVYTPDATGTQLGFSGTGLASSTSQTQLVIPEDGAITEFIEVAAPTAVGFCFSLDSASVQGGTVRHANVLSTLATRVTQLIPVRAGQILTALQY